MSLSFTSLRSSSAGNCLFISTAVTRLVIDCGFKSQRDCAAMLTLHAGGIGEIDAVLVSHAHSDHIGYPSLRLLSQHGVQIRADQRVIDQIYERHGCDDWAQTPDLQPFSAERFEVGDLEIQAIELPHDPSVATFGFVIYHGKGSGRRKIVVCTDFYNYTAVLHHFMDADFIFVESNHDLDLLEKHPNPASHYHLSNPRAAMLIYDAVRESQKPPKAVMLGHLSRQRNREELAFGAVRDVFAKAGKELAFQLGAAPLLTASRTIQFT